MIHIEKQHVIESYESLDSMAFIKYLTDQYLNALGGQLSAENMDELTADQHALLCYRYILDEVMEGGFIHSH